MGRNERIDVTTPFSEQDLTTTERLRLGIEAMTRGDTQEIQRLRGSAAGQSDQIPADDSFALLRHLARVASLHAQHSRDLIISAISGFANVQIAKLRELESTAAQIEHSELSEALKGDLSAATKIQASIEDTETTWLEWLSHLKALEAAWADFSAELGVDPARVLAVFSMTPPFLAKQICGESITPNEATHAHWLGHFRFLWRQRLKPPPVH